MGTGLAGRLHVAPPPRSGGASRPSACSSSGVEGIKADDGEGYYFPDDVRFADGTHRRRGRLGPRPAVPPLDAARAGRGPSRRPGVLFGRPGWTGQQAVGITWGGDQPSRLLVAADAGGRDADRRRHRASRTGRTTSAATSASGSWRAARRSCSLRWVQFGCFTPLMQAHGRFEQEAWTYDDETLADLPPLRAAARAARALRPRGGGDRGALPGCRSSGRWR